MHTNATQNKATEAYSPLRLKAPDQIQAVPRPGTAAQRLVPLKKEFKAKVDLLTQELLNAAGAGFDSAHYQEKLESSLAFGRKAADRTSRLVRRFVAKTFDGLEASPAYAAVGRLRAHFSALNPNNPDELMEPDKVFGLIPIGNKLNAYFKTYQAAVPELKAGITELSDARIGLENEAKDLNSAQDEIWAAMAKLEAAVYYTDTLGGAMNKQASALTTTEPEQALCLEIAAGPIQEAFDAWSTQQVNNVNTYLSMEALKKAYRELIAGLKQIESACMAALASAQTVAGVYGCPLNAVATLTEPIGSPSSTAQPSAAYVEKLEGFANNPRTGLAYIRETTSAALYSMRELDEFRFQAIGVLKQNYKLLQASIQAASPATRLSHHQAAGTKLAA